MFSKQKVFLRHEIDNIEFDIKPEIVVYHKSIRLQMKIIEVITRW